MTLSKNIAAILQQYEFAMSIGNHLDFEKNCDQFLKLVLAKKNLSNCWIIKESEIKPGIYNITYSYPDYNKKSTLLNNKTIRSCFDQQITSFYIDDDNDEILTKQLKQGAVLFANLNEHGGLFLHGYEKQEFSSIEITQLHPIIDKFIVSLTACESYSKKEVFLKKLKKQNKELQEYTQAISHDLKSPLRNINTLISWIKEENNIVDNDTIHNLNLITTNTEKMDAVINGILEYSSIDKTEITSIPLNVEKIITEIIRELNFSDAINFHLEDDLPIINGDTYRIQLLFQHLFNNAISSIGENKGTISIGVIEHKYQWCFYVKDTGKGIAKKYHDKIFQILQTLDDTKQSTGMGLTIIKKIIDLYEGEIWVESESGKGATFYFTLKK